MNLRVAHVKGGRNYRVTLRPNIYPIISFRILDWLVDGTRGIFFVVNGNIIFMVEMEITRTLRSMRFLLSETLVVVEHHEWV
jgi:hypothetical protein